MRFLSRFIGLVLAAGAFVAFVIDGARSIADSTLQTRVLGGVWVALDPAGYAAARAGVERDLSGALWEFGVMPVLATPLFVALMILAALFLFIGRRPRSRIGYAVRG